MNSLFSALGGLPSNSTLAPLYDAQDMVGLGLIESWWAAWYTWIGDAAIATNLLVFLSHEVCGFPSRALSSPADHLPDLPARLLWSGASIPDHGSHPLLQAVQAAAGAVATFYESHC